MNFSLIWHIHIGLLFILVFREFCYWKNANSLKDNKKHLKQFLPRKIKIISLNNIIALPGRRQKIMEQNGTYEVGLQNNESHYFFIFQDGHLD